MSNIEQLVTSKLSIPERILNRIGLGKYQYVVITLIGFIALSEGAGMITMAILNYVLHYVVWFEPVENIRFIGTAVFLGSGTGGLISGWFSDKYGRKYSISFAGMLVGVAGIISALSSLRL